MGDWAGCGSCVPPSGPGSNLWGAGLSLSVPLGLCSKFQARSLRCAAPSQRHPCPKLGHH